jgi:hypothetical protein
MTGGIQPWQQMKRPYKVIENLYARQYSENLAVDRKIDRSIQGRVEICDVNYVKYIHYSSG